MRNRLRPAVLARKVLVPPILVGAVVACLIGVLALTGAAGSRASDGRTPFGGDDGGKLAAALSIEIEGKPGARDIRAARLPYDVRRRQLERHPYYDLYVQAQQRYGVPWVLVASVHYQETGFGRHAKRAGSRRAIMSIARQLHEAKAGDGLGSAAEGAVAKRYGSRPQGDISTAMVIERARAWRTLGTIPLPGHGELLRPTAGVVGGCGYFGCPRPGHLHNGVDFLAAAGSPIHAVDAGRVVLIQTPGESGGYGNFTCVQHRPHLASCYAHQSALAPNLRVGSRVKRGEVIGFVGSTGSSSAPHLHFEVRRGPASCHACAVDPLPLLSDEVPEDTVRKILRAPAVARAARPAPVPSVARAPAPAPAPAQAAPPVSTTPSPAPAAEEDEPPLPPEPRVEKGYAGPKGGSGGAVPNFDPAPDLRAGKGAADPAASPSVTGGASGPVPSPAQP